MVVANSGGSSSVRFTSTSNTSGTDTVWFTPQGNNSLSRRSGPCNESKTHDNQEKALFHGMKSAFRMSRQSDGEYGTSGDPPYEQAAHIAARVAIAYLQTTDTAYDREESFEYLREKIVGDPRTIDRVLDFLGIKEATIDQGLASTDDLEAGIAQAWTQIDEKWHHDDGARTALAIAEAYLGEEIYDG